MTKQRVIPLFIIVLLFLNGCARFYHKFPLTQDTGSAIPKEIKDPATAEDKTISEINSVKKRPADQTSSRSDSNMPVSGQDNPKKEIDLIEKSPVSEPPETTQTVIPDPSQPAKDSSIRIAAVTKSETSQRPKADSKIDTPVKKSPPPPPSPKKIQAVLDEALDFCQAAQDFWQKGELENAFEALDQAYSLILKIDHADISPELTQQKEDLRFLISKRILEIYASRNIVVNGKHNAIPLEINSHVQREIDLFTKGKERNFFIESYRRSGRYYAKIVSTLEKAGLPAELSWLPLIESGFKVNALSRARALGLWQFIPSTGYKFGLKRNVYIDERLDPEKSTHAAIAYLKELHQIFGDWTTVLAAYNCGEGRVLRVIRDQNVNYLDNFWDLYLRLPRETARYVPRFIATLHILKNSEKYGIDSINPEPPIENEAVSITKQVHLRDVAKAIGVSEKNLKKRNPELRYNIVPKEIYSLKVPPGMGNLLLSKLDQIPTSSRPRPAYARHRVRPGETLSSIALRYRTSVKSIARANNIYKHNLIVAGKTLKIPQKGSFVYKSISTTKKIVKRPSKHIVNSGDSLWIIAKRYGTTTKEIQAVNKLSTTNLFIGQVLKMPGTKPEIPVSDGLKTYRVKSGDSPFKIAQRHKMPLSQFLLINRLTPRSKIYPGQKLFVE